MPKPADYPIGAERVSLELDASQAEALHSAAEYLSGFGQVFALMDDARYPVSDLLLVARTLGELHTRAIARAQAA